ncbi:MAG: hypothetical protein Kow0068_18430 [Marinilabiliales bacterium]
MKISLLILAIIISYCYSNLFGQATIKVMQYNLLYYGQTTTDCNTTNNSVTDKNNYLKTIVDYVLPDILTVNEMAPNMTYVQSLLNNVMNTSGRTYYKNGPYTNWAGSEIVNMVYYNSNKLTLYNSDYIFHSLRDISVYEFYYNSPDLAQGDTAFISCIVAHLKAGNTGSDAAVRDEMTTNIMTYVEGQGVGKNYLLMGDFNTYSSSEEAVKNITLYPSSPYLFHDPINKLGDWSNNSYYAGCHTQSTHTVSGCAAGGGLDDRFDFIFISDNIFNNIDKVSYITDSYHTIGQDGLHFNSAVNSGTNQDVSANIADALYGMSDHLPVVLELNIAQTPVQGIETITNGMNLFYNNPVNENLVVSFSGNLTYPKEGSLKIYNSVGELVKDKDFVYTNENYSITCPVDDLKNGIYFFVVNLGNVSSVKKIIKL